MLGNGQKDQTTIRCLVFHEHHTAILKSRLND